jgi:hypothetical protein
LLELAKGIKPNQERAANTFSLAFADGGRCRRITCAASISAPTKGIENQPLNIVKASHGEESQT